jgi:lipopolysaccharide/colanic/teichoic acid biosynthesis glycosyltransferase
VKRLMDVIGAAAGLIVAGLPMLLIASAIRIRMGAPVLHRSTRPGRDGVPFVMYKFRTMQELYDEHHRLLPDHRRITPLGLLLRRTSLDELPELYNVLRGDMSLVGPRPLLMRYLPLYSPEQARRHEVRPGVTGWAQIHGRNSIPWEEKLALDVWYVDHRSLAVDLKILATTVIKVVRREGMSADGDLDVPEFKGSAPA